MHIQYTMVFVSDMQQAIAFYRDVIGMPLKFESPEWTEFATTGATLALHATDTPAQLGAAGKNLAGSVRMGFNVPDLGAFHQRMLDHDVSCVREPKAEHGVKLAEYTGFDGITFTVAESRS